MTFLKLSLNHMWLPLGLLVNWSYSKGHTASQMRTTPFIKTPSNTTQFPNTQSDKTSFLNSQSQTASFVNTSLDTVHNRTFTTLSAIPTTDRGPNIIYEIGKTLCPYNDYCSRRKEFLFFTAHPCCEDCSCEDNCWETKTCCPDKKVIDVRAPIENCHVTIVKKRNKTTLYNGINNDIRAYRIIDKCPETERNLSIIKKCTLSDITHISDYNWVSNFSTGKIYQNKFCAACHGETGLIEWRMEARCEDVLYSNFSHLKSLLLSETCDIINREPSGSVDLPYKRCAIPLYTHCNQTGRWQKFDAKIAWACDMHESTFLETIFSDVYLYKNAFCYACNQQEIESAITVCKTTISNIRIDGRFVFSSLIDYQRDDQLASYQPAFEFSCDVNEMFDPYLQKCRTLICPFANTPFYGSCIQLVEHTYGLSVEVSYTLTVLQSNMDVLLADEVATLAGIGKKLLYAVQYNFFESEGQCRYCYQYLRLLKDIKQSMIKHSKSNINTGDNNSSDPHLLFYTLWYTDKVCQLQKLTNHALELAGSLVNVRVNANSTMSFKVALSKENDQPMIRSGTIIFESRRYPECFVTYKLATEVICPQTRISFSEFEPFMTEHNVVIINSMFTTIQMRSREDKEICVADLLEKLDDINFNVTQRSGSFQYSLQSVTFIYTLVIAQMIKM